MEKHMPSWLKYCLHIFALLCAGYGVFIMAARSGSFFFLFWFVLALLTEAFIFLYDSGWFAKLPKALKTVPGCVFAVLLGLFLYLEAGIITDFHPVIEETPDYLIVLGAQVHDGYVSRILQYRLDAAADYMQQNPETKAIVTGGQGFNEPYPEAEGMAAYLIARGIDEERIIKEDQADNTVQNIEYSFAMIDPEKDAVCIVTNQFHLHRALLLAKKAGAKHLCGIGAKSDPLYLLNNMVRESAALIKEYLSGNI